MSFRERPELRVEDRSEGAIGLLTPQILYHGLVDILVLHDHRADCLKLALSNYEYLLILDSLFEQHLPAMILHLFEAWDDLI